MEDGGVSSPESRINRMHRRKRIGERGKELTHLSDALWLHLKPQIRRQRQEVHSKSVVIKRQR